MNVDNVLSREFTFRYVPEEESLILYRSLNPNSDPAPIKLHLQTLEDLGPARTSKFVGETLLLLIPELRQHLFGLER